MTALQQARLSVFICDLVFVQTSGYSVVPTLVISIGLATLPSAFDVITERGEAASAHVQDVVNLQE